MKKLFVAISLFIVTAISAQQLTEAHKIMLKNDDISSFSSIISQENINTCYSIEDNSYSLLALSIKMNKVNLFQKLVNEKADLENICDGKTPLMFAAKYGNAGFVKKLLEHGAKKEARTSKGYTALDYAKKYEKTEIIKLLE